MGGFAHALRQTSRGRVVLATTCNVKGAAVIEGEAEVKIGSSAKRAARSATK